LAAPGSGRWCMQGGMSSASGVVPSGWASLWPTR
jgi:hypothetical protein